MSNQDAIEKLESKLASGEIAPDYHVRQAIVTRYAENHGGLQLVGGVLVAVVGFSLVGWMGGVGIGLIAAQHMLNWHKKRSQDWRAIDSGRYAHLLTPVEAKHYERIYGRGSLQAAKQGDYSHAGIESEEAIDVPAEAVEDAKKSDATVEPTPDIAVVPDEAAPVDATSADASAGNDEPAADNRDSRTPTPIALTDDRFSWAKDLLHFPAVLIWGAQGSGKTSFASWLLHQRIAAGHSTWVCDPHKEYGQWNGLKCVGAGMDYEACDRAMIQFANTVKREYKTRSEQANYKPQRETVLVEEFTNWADRCENAGEFFKASLSDLRKIKKGVIFVSHDRSLVALGNAKGFSKARNNGLLELHLEAVIDPTTGEPKPAMKGKLKLPGKTPIKVEISPEMRGSMDFTQAISVEAASAIASGEQQRLRDRLEGLYQENLTFSDLPNFSEGTSQLPDSPSNSPEAAEAGKSPSENLEMIGSTGEVDFQRSDDWRKFFPEAPSEIEEVTFRAFSAYLEAGKRKSDFIAEVLRCGSGGRRYQAASKYLDYLSERFKK